MMKKYLLCALVSMVPLIELRAGVPIAVGMGLPYINALIVCVIANMLPVPVIYFFARKVLEWAGTSVTSASSSPTALRRASAAEGS